MADGRLLASGRRPAGTPVGGRSPAHGFGDDEATRKLLRSRPSRQALAWAAAQLGAPVISARALRGGMSSAVHLLITQPPGGQRRYAVLRRYVRPELNAEEPDIAAREARALGAAGSAGLSAAALLAVDPAGTAAGVPAILMSRLPGRVEWWPSDTGRWLRRLAELLPRIHTTPLPAPGTLRRFAPDPQESYRPPGWTRQPRLWERAAEISCGPAPDLPAVLVHRDFHPGNVLWQRGAVTGVIDWQAACTGPAVADVGHCRINLLTTGTDAAGRFTAWWQQMAGTAYHPWADVVTIIGFLDDLRDGWDSERLLVEDMLARAVAELGGQAGWLRGRRTCRWAPLRTSRARSPGLLEVLERAAGVHGLEYERRPEPLRGGFWAELLSFSLADPPAGWPAGLVARLMPDPASARKETIVQSAVAAAGFPTPSVRAAGGPDDGLGRAFMIMDLAPGRPALSGLDGGLTPAAVPRLLRQIPDMLATAMARLHALDPGLVRDELEQIREVPVTVPDLLAGLARYAGELGRPDLAGAARWLAGHPPAPGRDVICHGDLHPFNLLADGDRVTVLDWSTALLAPPAHDVAFTSLLLSEPPLRVPGWERPLIRMLGRVLGRRFARGYRRRTAAGFEPGEVRWHQAVVCLRALTEVASWVRDGTADARAGHPWLVCGPAFARRLAALTGVPVRAR